MPTRQGHSPQLKVHVPQFSNLSGAHVLGLEVPDLQQAHAPSSGSQFLRLRFPLPAPHHLSVFLPGYQWGPGFLTQLFPLPPSSILSPRAPPLIPTPPPRPSSLPAHPGNSQSRTRQPALTPPPLRQSLTRVQGLQSQSVGLQDIQSRCLQGRTCTRFSRSMNTGPGAVPTTSRLRSCLPRSQKQRHFPHGPRMESNTSRDGGPGRGGTYPPCLPLGREEDKDTNK